MLSGEQLRKEKTSYFINTPDRKNIVHTNSAFFFGPMLHWGGEQEEEEEIQLIKNYDPLPTHTHTHIQLNTEEQQIF